MTEPVFATLQRTYEDEGVILFTLSLIDEGAALARRIHTSHPKEYPLGGVKPMTRDAWYDVCIAARAPFVANTPAEFSALFPDHGLITSMGLGSCVNLPVIGGGGKVIGTVNLLAGQGHFSARVVQDCQGILSLHSAELAAAMGRVRL